MKLWALVGGLAITVATSASGQVRPQAGSGDPRIQSVDYKPDQVVQIEAAPGYQVTIALAPDEQVQTVALGDSSAWQVSASKGGDHLFVKPVQTGASTNMTVVTDTRQYAFDLTALPSPSPNMAYSVQFRYPTAVAVQAVAATPSVGLYRVSGSRALRPIAIDDDGVHTYIEWRPDAALPAIYALDGQDRETLVNGNVRDKLYVIDSINPHLVFRIDRMVARADRFIPKPKKRK